MLLVGPTRLGAWVGEGSPSPTHLAPPNQHPAVPEMCLVSYGSTKMRTLSKDEMPC